MLRRLGVVLLFLSACGGPSPTLPFQVMAYTLGSDGAYKVQPVELKTLTDPTGMQGDIASFIGGARIVVDDNDPLLSQNITTLDQYRQVLVKGAGGIPRASYVEKDGVLWPVDFHTWNMVAAYYNLERAYEYFEQTGAVDVTQLRGKNAPPVYYFPDFIFTQESTKPGRDNAYYFSPLDCFAFLPFEETQQVPYEMNFGVLAHEYSHRVFNRKVFNGDPFPAPLLRWGGTVTPEQNLIKSLDEGLADYHAVMASCLQPAGCDPRFLSYSSAPNDPLVRDRDISRADQCISEGLRTALDSLNLSEFQSTGRQYTFGDIFAAALYQAGAREGKHKLVQKAVLDAYSDASAGKPGLSQLITDNLETPQGFTLAKVANTVLQHVSDPGLKTTLCNEFQDRLKIAKDTMPDCPVNAAGGTKCPALP